MLKIFIAARSATSVSAAFAEVRVAGAAHAHKYFPRCAEGMGHGACVFARPRVHQVTSSFAVRVNGAIL
jgi:hypothetical protein